MRPLILILTVALLSGCSILQAEARYEVTGAGTAKITWLAGGLQSGDESLPFSATATAPRGVPSQFNVSAIGSSSSGTLKCSLYIDGELVSSQSSSGALPIVSCSG